MSSQTAFPAVGRIDADVLRFANADIADELMERSWKTAKNHS